MILQKWPWNIEKSERKTVTVFHSDKKRLFHIICCSVSRDLFLIFKMQEFSTINIL